MCFQRINSLCKISYTKIFTMCNCLRVFLFNALAYYFLLFLSISRSLTACSIIFAYSINYRFQIINVLLLLWLHSNGMGAFVASASRSGHLHETEGIGSVATQRTKNRNENHFHNSDVLRICLKVGNNHGPGHDTFSGRTPLQQIPRTFERDNNAFQFLVLSSAISKVFCF